MLPNMLRTSPPAAHPVIQACCLQDRHLLLLHRLLASCQPTCKQELHVPPGALPPPHSSRTADQRHPPNDTLAIDQAQAAQRLVHLRQLVACASQQRKARQGVVVLDCGGRMVLHGMSVMTHHACLAGSALQAAGRVGHGCGRAGRGCLKPAPRRLGCGVSLTSYIHVLTSYQVCCPRCCWAMTELPRGTWVID